MKLLYVLYDRNCELCRRCKNWLAKQPKYIDMIFIAQQSNQVKIIMPDLVNDLSLDDLILVSDTGLVYKGKKAWIMCMYALKNYREWSLLFARPGFDVLTRAVVHQISSNRKSISGALLKLNASNCETGNCDIHSNDVNKNSRRGL